MSKLGINQLRQRPTQLNSTDLVAVHDLETGEDVAVPVGSVGGGTLPDPLVANIIPRYDTLANLLALTGNLGELMVPSNAPGIVVQLPAGQGGTQLLGMRSDVRGISGNATAAGNTLTTALPFKPRFIVLSFTSNIGAYYGFHPVSIDATGDASAGVGVAIFPQYSGGYFAPASSPLAVSDNGTQIVTASAMACSNTVLSMDVQVDAGADVAVTGSVFLFG